MIWYDVKCYDILIYKDFFIKDSVKIKIFQFKFKFYLYYYIIILNQLWLT
jgi:hypothetical protein